MKRLLDTNAVLYLLGGRLAEALPAGEYFVSVISEMELLSWPLLSSGDEARIRDFLAAVKILGLESNVRDRAVEVRKRYGLKLPDAIIAATALVSDADLVTNDRKMARVPGLRVYSLLLRDEGEGVRH